MSVSHNKINKANQGLSNTKCKQFRESKDWIKEMKLKILNNYNKCHLIKICQEGLRES